MPSEGFSYTWSESAPAGSRVDPASIRIAGRVVEPSAGYRVTVNSFLADGGDGFPLLTEGVERTEGMADVDALKAYLETVSPVVPVEPDRIRAVP